MGRRAFVWSGMLLAVGALYGATAPWSYALPPCTELPAAQRERDRLAGRCEGRAPIVNVAPKGRTGAVARRPVPDLRGRRFDSNDQRLARFVVAIDYRESAARRDWVVDQMPRPPATLPDGGNLRIVLSDGTLIRVPDVRGNFARALATLHRAGLSWTTGDPSTGRVVGQQPRAGTAVRPGTQVVLRTGPGPVALAPESTRPEIAPAPPPAAPPTSTVPGPPPAGTTAPPPAPRTPPATSPAPRTAPSTTAMPDLQGMVFEAARAQLDGFNVQRIHRAGTEPGGTVIGQSPAAGTALAPGQTVRLVLSDGSLVRVPRVTSFTLNEARQRLANGELRVAVTSVTSDAPAGTIVSQQPAEGQIAGRGSTVRVTVSAGPPAAPAPLAVPDLVGALADRAQPRLERFRVERTERAAREPVGTILEQSPAPGSLLEPGGTVSITVSSGGRPESIEVADMVGRDADAAATALSEFRLEREVVPGVAPAGRVLAQEPAPGAAAAPGSTIRLRVSDGSRVVAPALSNMTLAEAREAARAAGLAVAVTEGEDDARARVLRQVPAAGAEAARGSAVQLAVQARTLPFGVDVPPAVRDAGARASAAVGEMSARTVAMAVVLVLFVLLALALVVRRRGRARYVLVEPRFEARDTEPREPILPREPREKGMPREAREPVAPKRAPAVAPPPAELRVEPRAAKAAAAKVIPASVAASAAGTAAPAQSHTPEPTAPSPAAAPPLPAAAPEAQVPTAAPVTAAPPDVAAASEPRSRLFARRPPAAVTPPAPAPEPVAFGARARLDADPQHTVAVGAAPRGPEIRIAARLEAGDARVRELPAATAPDELTEETK